MLCTLSFLLQWRYDFGMADEGWLWYVARRTWLGDVPLRDFYSYDPGRYYWTGAFFSVLGDTGFRSVLLAAAAFGALGLTLVWLTMGAAALGWRWRLSCAAMLTLALGVPRHKAYEASLSLVSIAAVFLVLRVPGSTRRWFAFGLASGLAAFIGRNSGLYLVMSATACFVALLGSGRREVVRGALVGYPVGALLGYAPALAMSALVDGFGRALVESLLFVTKFQEGLPIPFPWRLSFGNELTLDELHKGAIGAASILIPALYGIGVVVAWKRLPRGGERRPQEAFLEAACLAGLPFLLQAFRRADVPHILQGSLPVIPVLMMLAYFSWHGRRWARACTGALGLGAVVLLTCWLVPQPAVRFARIAAAAPESLGTHAVGGREFVMARSQAKLLTTLEQVVATCKVRPDEVLAAPLFPGIYPFLNAKAPFWELYYCYQRPLSFQQRHVEALTNTRLVVLAEDASVDGLERLKLRATYGLLLDYIHEHFEPVASEPALGVVLWTRRGSCPALSNTTTSSAEARSVPPRPLP